jgi:hypothetical protein
MNQGQAQKILVETAGFFGIPAAISIMMKAFDHGVYPVVFVTVVL